MSNAAFYDSIERANAEPLARGELEPDRYLNGSMPDPRRCVSVIVPILACVDAYRRCVAGLPEPLRAQYVYPPEDLHVTVFDMTDAREGYNKDDALERAYIELFERLAARMEPFELALRGAILTRNAGIIRGLDAHGGVQTLRDELRRGFAERGLPNRERLVSASAHVTFLRWLSPPRDLAALNEGLAATRSIDLGIEGVRVLELVEHDWYNRSLTRKVLSRAVLP